MTRIFRPRLEILPSAQRRLWPQLQPSVKLGMVLYGGTAIALRLGHRASVDFDFFTDKPLCKEALQAALPFIAGAAVLQDQPDTFTVVVSEGEAQAGHVKLSFFGGIGFGRVGEPEATEDGVVRVASLADLMATKSKVILQRVEARDYQDIAAMIRAGVSLSSGLAAARALYGLAFQPSESLKAMVYFEGGDLNSLSTEDKETLIDAASGVRDLPNVQIAARNLG
ncbi:MAG: nucleotidyl transferase AbiEii/AbiGii toxin family protein [Pseudomonadota bacterium]|nr:nucleotidyl transferase AbiEii/AbiGii toxin family protein [Pseudomonadota bacterium]